MLRCKFGLDFVILQDFAFHCVHHKDFARPEPAFGGYFSGRNIAYSGFGCHYEHTSGGDEIAAGPQPVSVQHTSGVTSIGEEYGGRTVPRFGEDGVVFIETFQPVSQWVAFLVAFRNQH